MDNVQTGIGPKRRSPPLPSPDSFSPTLGELDLHLFGEGRHERIYEKLGAHCLTHEGVTGVSFAVWAPNANRVSVVGNFNGWDGAQHPDAAAWEVPASGKLFIPDLRAGELYKYEIRSAGLPTFLQSRPLRLSTLEVPPNTSSIVFKSKYKFRDRAWMEKRASREHLSATAVDLRSAFRIVAASD